MKTAFAEVDARAARLGAAFEDVAGVMPSHHAGVAVSHIPAAGPDLRCNFAGLAPTGYSDTSGAPSAILRR
ncbi:MULTISPECIES: hypothetical protein [unclassified Rhizobium]|uniref:hypothetical protein n=1 Tax=unclassified Rhizobium TaxID=2613769 RepID=UPI0013C51540|nr:MULTISPECIES: hypothetical protein [unclassified Rhizobium]